MDNVGFEDEAIRWNLLSRSVIDEVCDRTQERSKAIEYGVLRIRTRENVCYEKEAERWTTANWSNLGRLNIGGRRKLSGGGIHSGIVRFINNFPVSSPAWRWEGSRCSLG